MNLVNLTPHAIVVRRDDGADVIFPAAARAASSPRPPRGLVCRRGDGIMRFTRDMLEAFVVIAAVVLFGLTVAALIR